MEQKPPPAQTAPQPAKQPYEAGKQKWEHWIRQLRDDLCGQLESLETGGQTFARKSWQRGAEGEDLGGGEMAILKGDLLEKAGVHISTVYGEFSEPFRQQIEGTEDDPRFWASGISAIIHPKNPHAPSAHMNTRMIITSKGWFGGGADLTPMLARDRRADHPDTQAFHDGLKQACDKHDARYYPRFKAECETYFFLPHRNETRGTGGIFYDQLNTGDWQADFAFTQSLGRAFAALYPAIVRQRMHNKYNETDRAEQLMQRGRYAEFNLLYDRGTKFGLQTGGNVESILSSLPPLARWP